jgi:hypothetical protein
MNITTTEFKNQEVKSVSVKIALCREDALALIRTLATHGEQDATMMISVWESTDEHLATVSIDGGMGPILPAERIMVRIDSEVTA